MRHCRADIPNRCCHLTSRVARRAFEGVQASNRNGRAAMTSKTYCGNLLWQSCMTLLRRGWAIILFFMFFVQGCEQRFEITDDVVISKSIWTHAYALAFDSKIEKITELWKYGSCFYGYHYNEDQYEMFAVDLRGCNMYLGEEASRFVLKEGLPVDRWTNPDELFGVLITDGNRREKFLQHCNDGSP